MKKRSEELPTRLEEFDAQSVKDPILEMMKRLGEPLTVERYLELSYPPNGPEEPLDAESLSMIPMELDGYDSFVERMTEDNWDDEDEMLAATGGTRADARPRAPEQPHGLESPDSTETKSTSSSRSSEQRQAENDLFRKLLGNPMPMAPDLEEPSSPED
jgi:hypothetical protein